MKKILLTIFGSFLLVCNLPFSINAQDLLPKCKQQVVQAQLEQTPDRIARMQAFNSAQDAAQADLKNHPEKRQIYKIPVVFHILHYNGPENISNEQIYDAMAVLNRDYNLQNDDQHDVTSLFNANNPNATATPANVGVEFVLATKAPDGTCFNGITRTVSNKTITTSNGFVQLDEVMHRNDVYRGVWPTKNYLNIIVCVNLGNAAGYTFLPASFNGTNMYGSIWVNYQYVGRIGTGSEVRSRTLTHEVGHWLNLYHTWGPTNEPGMMSNCDFDDDVTDTPNTVGSTSCNLGEHSCGPVANVENYMDYSYCSKMFTPGQALRMQAALQVSPRNTVWTAENLAFTGADGSNGLCSVDFRTTKDAFCAGEDVSYHDYSATGATSWNWTFEGGTPATSTEQNPVVTYAQPGTYDVTLTASDGTNTVTKTKSNFVRINSIAELPYFESFENYDHATQISNVTIRNFTPNEPTFDVVNTAAATGEKSLCLYNYYMTDESINEFVSPMFDLSNLSSSDKVTLTFKYAFRKKVDTAHCTLSIIATKDCGNSWMTRKQLLGNSFSNQVDSFSFVPSPTDFITVHTTGIGNTFFTSNFQFKIQADLDGGNNLYLDDINLYKGAPSNENVVGLNDLKTQVPLNIYPNPTAENATLSYDLKVAKNIQLRVTDISGKVVYENQFISPAGKNQILLDVSQYTTGIYLIQLGNQTKKLIVK